MRIEETKYAVVITANEFEIRDYESHILAESIVDGDFEDAGSLAFNRLFWFISGDNFPCNELALSMTLAERSASTKIKMTSPVGLKGGNGHWAVRFMMPSCYTLQNLPQPADFGITVTEDHLKLREAFLEFENSGAMDFESKQNIVERICQDLLIHMIAEENIFYPTIQHHIKHGQDTVGRSIAEHEEAKAVIIQLQHMTPDNTSYNLTVKILSDLFHNHILEEESYVFPLVKETSLNLDELGIQIEKAKNLAE
ncbi:MAG: heme-binding protein [Legionellales bacterium]